MNRILLLALLLLATACAPSGSFSELVDFGNHGWERQKPVVFSPKYIDSTACYDVFLTFRHNTRYEFSNLCVAVDFIDSLHHASRVKLCIPITDSHGKWTGSGFGGVYQQKVKLRNNMPAGSTSTVTVWHTMQGCDTLRHIDQMGLLFIKR